MNENFRNSMLLLARRFKAHQEVVIYLRAMSGTTRGVDPYGNKYRVEAGMNSGEPGTTVLNTAMTMMMILCFIKHVRSLSLRKFYKCHNEFRDWFFQFGYDMGGGFTQDRLAVTYLSGFFITTSVGLVWIPLIGRLLSRLGWTTSHPNRTNLMAFKATLLGYVEYSWVPIIGDYIRTCLALLPGKAVEAEETYRPHVEGIVEATPETLEEIYIRYHLNGDMYRSFLEELRTVTVLPYVLTCDLIDRCCLVDYG